jgi:AbrB family looped-hinge helix DNA binding protein
MAKYCILENKINLIFKYWRPDDMELAKITTRGQITLPIAIRKKLNVKDGNKVVFIEENGRIVIENAGMLALREARKGMVGVAESLGITDEQGVVDMMKDVRKERGRKK